nr:MAG TPA: hypothetical protein [Caudoviricetes sp.]
MGMFRPFAGKRILYGMQEGVPPAHKTGHTHRRNGHILATFQFSKFAPFRESHDCLLGAPSTVGFCGGAWDTLTVPQHFFCPKRHLLELSYIKCKRNAQKFPIGGLPNPTF